MLLFFTLFVKVDQINRVYIFKIKYKHMCTSHLDTYHYSVPKKNSRKISELLLKQVYKSVCFTKTSNEPSKLISSSDYEYGSVNRSSISLLSWASGIPLRGTWEAVSRRDVRSAGCKIKNKIRAWVRAYVLRAWDVTYGYLPVRLSPRCCGHRKEGLGCCLLRISPVRCGGSEPLAFQTIGDHYLPEREQDRTVKISYR